MKRYYLAPYLVPTGVSFQLGSLIGGTPDYQMMDKVWGNIIELLQRKWYRRFPFRFYEPWISWEVYADDSSTRYFLWATEDDLGNEIVDRMMVEDDDLNVRYAQTPSLDFTRPHCGMKLLLERDFCVPLEIFRDSQVDSQTTFLEFLSNLKEGEQIAAQFLVRPVYEQQVKQSFRKACVHM